MLDPDLISSRIYEASPDGRLARLEAILCKMLDDGEDVSAHHFNKYVVWAREARNEQKMADMLHYITKADAALTLMDYINDPDRLRGMITIEAAKKGGEARKSGNTARVITEMRRLLIRGGSVAWAAETAHKNGFGSSGSANRAIWYRYGRQE